MGLPLCADTKEVMCFKRSAHSITILLMFVAMAFTITLYIRNIITMHTNTYFVARARHDVTDLIDFENVTTTKVLYFLYHNET